jgi:hypothetical protein
VVTDDDDDRRDGQWECGVSEDHDLPVGLTECRRCGADLAHWYEEDDDEGMGGVQPHQILSAQDETQAFRAGS